MFPKCAKCSKNISLSWIINAFAWTKFRCVQCCSLYEFTKWRGPYAVIIGIITLVSVELLEPYIESIGLRFLFSLFIALPIFAILPAQHKLCINKGESVKKT